MKPSVQKIIAKLAKEKVELGLMDDLIKENNKADKLYKEAIKFIDEYENTIKKAEQIKKEAQNLYDKHAAVKTKTFQKFKELGGDLLNTLRQDKNYRDAVSAAAGLDLIIRKLKKV